MMGRQPDYQHKLFVTGFNLERRVRKDHVLRKIRDTIDFTFIYNEVKDTYGVKGNVSVPPPVILKMMLLLILYNVRSERELMATIPERLDWLYFLGYDLDDDIPNHSVLSKARARWGVKAFQCFFERIVLQCVEAGLVDGSKLFTDTSLIDANASNNSVVDTHSLIRYLNDGYRQLERRLDEGDLQKSTPANSTHISTTDPDAAVTRHSSGTSNLRYKTHRGVDEHHEVITATTVTTGSVDDGEMLKAIIDQHERNTSKAVDTIVADSRYGKIDNYLLCHDRTIRAHVPSLEATQRGSGRQKGIFPKEAFTYHPETDTFTCPAGQILKRRHHYRKRNHDEYKAAAQTCATCELKGHCTRSKQGRTVKRHLRQHDLDRMRHIATTRQAKQDIKTRQHLSERSFARSMRYGFKRARWRRVWRVQIQDFLIAAIQNIMVLITQPQERLSKSNAAEAHTIRGQQAQWNSFSFGLWIMRLLRHLTMYPLWTNRAIVT